jgi:hypothetical protein
MQQLAVAKDPWPPWLQGQTLAYWEDWGLQVAGQGAWLFRQLHHLVSDSDMKLGP